MKTEMVCATWLQAWTADRDSIMSKSEMPLGDSQKYVRGALQEDRVPQKQIGTRVREALVLVTLLHTCAGKA